MMRHRPAAGLGVVEANSVVYLAPLPEGPIIVLDGFSAAIWLAACSGPAETIAERVADEHGLPADEIRAASQGFLLDMVERGLLVDAHEAPEVPEAREPPGSPDGDARNDRGGAE